jgi:hypothetical protein
MVMGLKTRAALFLTAATAIVLAAQVPAAAECNTIYVNGQARVICSPPPPPPPGTGCGVFCRPAPTR